MRLPRIRLTVRQMMALVAVAAVVLALVHGARELVAPSDWVDVTVRNVPPGLRQIYLIADGPDGPRAFNWYFDKLLAWTESSQLGQNWYRNPPSGQRFGHVQWPLAGRYGAVAQRSDGTWELWWLGPDDLRGPSAMRYIAGGGTAEVRIPDESRATSPTPEFLKQLGLPDRPRGTP
ncbi:hypothetical protein [Aquisphaera insulae]|uniref:hypothetical protein n=1 Tax=Aquisphaera insulae TaxID=2712864 RepID=UPI0013EC1F9A|nr:hypothetical protein [Aquisphaera insulae]